MNARQYFGQSGADCLLWSLFEGRPSGFFVDVGAFDGVHLNDTLSFEREGWKGICIEAHPVFVRMCARNRRESLCLHAACVSDPAIDRTAFLMEPLGLLSGVCADQIPDLEARYTSLGMKFPGFAKVSVPARTLDRILKEHLPPGTIIDLLSVDVQGAELAVIEGLDLARFPVRVIAAEAKSHKAAHELTHYLSKQGYFLARELAPDLFFVRDQHDVQLLRGARVDCRTEMTLHPLGERATSRESVGRNIHSVPLNCPCDNVLRQEPGQPLFDLLKPYIESNAPERSRVRHRKFAHIVHTYRCARNSAGEITQQFALATLARAKEMTKESDDVELLSVHLGEDDMDFPPPAFGRAGNLARTVLDVRSFRVPRALPLLFDILEKGVAAAGDAEFIVFTNSDICLMPHFYQFVSGLLDLGFDTLIINRRVTGTFPMQERWRPFLESDYGAVHPGFDCFVFPAEFARRFVRSNCCVGAPYVMRSLLFNLVALSKSMLMLTDVHATYHIGSDSPAQRPELDDYVQFNQENARAVLDALCSNGASRRRLRDFCKNHHEFVVPEES